MKRVYQKGELLPDFAISHDVRPVRLSDGRTVMLTGLEALQAGNAAADWLRRAQEIAYDEERKPRESEPELTICAEIGASVALVEHVAFNKALAAELDHPRQYAGIDRGAVRLPGLKGLWTPPDEVTVNEAGVPVYTWTMKDPRK